MRLPRTTVLSCQILSQITSLCVLLLAIKGNKTKLQEGQARVLQQAVFKGGEAPEGEGSGPPTNACLPLPRVLCQLENYIQDNMKKEMVEMQQNAVQNQTAVMIEIGTNLLNQTAEQTRKLTDVEAQVGSGQRTCSGPGRVSASTRLAAREGKRRPGKAHTRTDGCGFKSLWLDRNLKSQLPLVRSGRSRRFPAVQT